MAPRRSATSAAPAPRPSKAVPSSKVKGNARVEKSKPKSTKAGSKTATAAAIATTKTKTKPAVRPAPASAKRARPADKDAPPAKRVRTTAQPPKQRRALPKINELPTQRLDVYVMGEGGNNELGLGTDRLAIRVKRPRLNKLLDADSVGVVQAAAGGMHAIVLTHDSRILSWGVNDDGALGRSTTDTSKTVNVNDKGEEVDDNDDSDDEDTNGLSYEDCTPLPIPTDSFPPGTRFTQLVAGDSACFAVTEEGLVYGWGNVRGNSGSLGFQPDVDVSKGQRTPVLIPELKNITAMAAGNNHFLALNKDGTVFAWGAGEQYELGRRPVERHLRQNLKPIPVPLLPKKKIRAIAAGAYHSFAIERDGTVWAWGLNADAQCGDASGIGAEDLEHTCITKPRKMDELKKYNFRRIDAGNLHSVGISETGDAIVWGKAKDGQLGLDFDDVAASSKVIKGGEVEIISVPTVLPEVGKVSYVAAAGDYTLWITEKGQVYSHGDNQAYQCGQGPEGDKVEEATLIDNTATRGKKLNWAGGGGQFAMLAGVHGATIDGVASAAAPAQAPSKVNGSAKPLTNGVAAAHPPAAATLKAFS